MINISNTLACHRTSWTVLKASGKDIRTYLQSQITQDISLLSPEYPIYTAVLTPQGKMVADMYLMDTSDEIIMITGTDHALALVERLRRFSMGHEIRLGLVESLSVISIQGEACQTWQQHIPTLVQAAMPMTEAAEQGCWLVVEKTVIGKVFDLLSNETNLHICDDLAMEQATVVYGKPRFGRDWDASTHPMNANLLEMKGVSFDKGCYIGQEVTSRMHWRGGVKKKLYHVQLSAMPTQTPCPIQSTANIGILTRATMDDKGDVWGITHLPIESVEKQTPLTAEQHITIKILEACHA